MNWIECIILFAVALGVTIALTPLARRLAIALDAIDYPSARRVNMQPIPRMGGVAIFGGMVAALALALVGAHFWGWTTPLQGGLGNKVNWIGVAVGILIMFGVGIVDDIYNLKPKAKLLGQIVAACVVAFSGLLFSSIHNFISDGYFEFGWLSYPLTVFYLVAFANIINLIDGLDGLAAGITAITAATIGILAVLTWRPGAALASFVIVGACIGFLKSNIHPASIFMGDSGAQLLGFALGIVSLMAVARSAFFVSLLVPIIAAGVPILDTAIAIIRRKRAHQPIDSADRGHIHHRLLQAGYSQKATVYIMWGWTALLSAGAIVVSAIDGPRAMSSSLSWLLLLASSYSSSSFFSRCCCIITIRVQKHAGVLPRIKIHPNARRLTRTRATILLTVATALHTIVEHVVEAQITRTNQATRGAARTNRCTSASKVESAHG